jgi:hypothetical protein
MSHLTHLMVLGLMHGLILGAKPALGARINGSSPWRDLSWRSGLAG